MWKKVCSLDELREGEPLGVEIDAKRIGLFLVNGQCHAIGDICPHEYPRRRVRPDFEPRHLRGWRGHPAPDSRLPCPAAHRVLAGGRAASRLCRQFGGRCAHGLQASAVALVRSRRPQSPDPRRRATHGRMDHSRGAGCAFVLRHCDGRQRSPRQSAASSAAAAPTRAVIDPSGFFLLGLCMALFNLATFIAIGHLTAFGEERGFAPAMAAAITSVMLGVTLVSRLSMGRLSQRFGHYRALAAVSALHVLGVVLLAASDNYWAVLVAVLLIGLGFGGYVPAYAVLVRDLFPAAQAGRRIAEVYFFAFLSAGAGSWLGGVARDISGNYVLPFCIAAGSAIAGALLLLYLAGRLRRV